MAAARVRDPALSARAAADLACRAGEEVARLDAGVRRGDQRRLFPGRRAQDDDAPRAAAVEDGGGDGAEVRAGQRRDRPRDQPAARDRLGLGRQPFRVRVEFRAAQGFQMPLGLGESFQALPQSFRRLVGTDVQQLRQLGEERPLVVVVAQRVRPGQRLDAAQAGADGRLPDDVDGPRLGTFGF